MSSTKPYGLVLDLDVRKGSARQIFGYGFTWPPFKTGSNKMTLKWLTELNKNILPDVFGRKEDDYTSIDQNETLETALEEIPEANCISLKMKRRVENTRLPPFSAPSGALLSWYNNPSSVRFLSFSRDPKLNFISENFSKREPTLTSSEHSFSPLDSMTVPFIGQGFLVDCFFGCNASYREVVPGKNNTVIRILQDSPDPWISGALATQDVMPSNPEMYIELELKEAPAEQSTDEKGFSLTPRQWYKRVANSAYVSPGAARQISLKNRLFGLRLGYGTSEEVVVVFQDSMVPYAVREHDKSVCLHKNGTQSCNFPTGDMIRLEVRWIPPGFYKITTNILESPFYIKFRPESLKEENENVIGSKKDIYNIFKIPSAPLLYFFVGLGVHTFAFSPSRYPIFANAVAEIPKLYPIQNSPQAAALNNLALKPENAIITPYVYSKQTNDPMFGSCLRYYLLYRTFLQDDDRKTPYFFYLDFEPVMPDLEIQPAEEPPRVEGVKRITLSPTVESLYKIKVNGTITLTNFNGEWDNAPQAQPIKIRAKWAIPFLETNVQQPEGKPPQRNVDYDTEAIWSTIFTGYMVKPKLERKGIKEKYVTFELRDRWYSLSVNKIENSPFYDGSSLYDALVDLLTSAGIRKSDIQFSQKAEKMAKEYALAMAPGYYFNPKFRFPFATTYEKAIDEVMKTVRLFYRFSGKGEFIITSPEDMIKPNNEAKTYYASLDDIPVSNTDPMEPYRILTNYEYTKDTDSMYNWFQVRGYDYSGEKEKDVGGSLTKTYGATSIDIRSLIDPSYPYYLGFPAPFYMAKTWLASQHQVNYMANELRLRFSRPREEVSWTVPYYVGDLIYEPIKFKDKNGSIPEDKIFHITSISFDYDSSTLKASSHIRATVIQDILEGKLLQV